MKVLTEGKINAFLESSGVYWNGGRGKGQYTDADGNIRVLRMFWRSRLAACTTFLEFICKHLAL